MPLPIRDGNQSLTTLSTLIVNSAHVPAHTVVSLGSQAITDIAQAVSGVELGPNSISALEHISVTISAGTSITVGNVVSVTGGLTNAELRASSVTVGGSVQVSNLPATQTVTFTQASVTFGTPVVTGSVSVLNFPATQSVTFTTAPVTFGQAVVSASNIGDILSGVGTDNTADATTKFFKIGGHQDGSNQISHIVHVSAGGAMKVDASDSSVTFGAIQGTVTIGNSVTISNFPATQTISGTVTVGASSVTFNSNVAKRSDGSWHPLSVETASGYVSARVYPSDIAPFLATVTVGNSVTIGSLPAISGTVTANGGDFVGEQGDPVSPQKIVQIGWYDENNGEFLKTTNNSRLPIANSLIEAAVKNDGNPIDTAFAIAFNQGGTARIPSETNPLPISGTVTVGNSVTIGSLPAISGTVTANVSVDNNFVKITDSNGDDIFLDNGNLPISGTVTATVIDPDASLNAIIADGIINFASLEVPLTISGTVTVGNSVTIGSLPAISGTVTANAFIYNVEEGYDEAINQSVLAVHVKDLSGNVLGSSGSPLPISGTVTVGNSVTIGSLPAISGTVTANVVGTRTFLDSNAVTVSGFLAVGGWDNTNSQHAPIPLNDGATGVKISYDDTGVPIKVVLPSGALTTRFGSVTTANTAQITSAVTNTSRKYLLAQNISAGTVTIGIGFSPTTTQGIQLAAGAGLTFDAFCPTGAIYWLGSVTGAAFTILEG